MIEISDISYTRKSVEVDIDTMYIFTDNVQRTSSPNATDENVDKNGWYYKKYKPLTNKPIHYGSLRNPTSAIIRGLDNAYPISTMSAYGTNWIESNIDEFKKVIDDEVNQIKDNLSKFKKLKIGNYRIGQGGKFARLPKQHQEYLDTKLKEVGIDNTNSKPIIINMTEIDFDSWDDYVPLGSVDLKTITPKEVENDKLIKLSHMDDFEILGDTLSKDEFFDIESEEDYHGNEFVRFIKYEEKGGISVFNSPKNEDIYLILKAGKKYVLYNYQNSNFYFDDNKLTFTGWDSNLIVNLDDMTTKTKHIR